MTDIARSFVATGLRTSIGFLLHRRRACINLTIRIALPW